MSDGETDPPTRLRESTTILKMALTAAALAAAAILAVSAVLRFADSERERELRVWQTRLGIIADSRAAAVEAWLEAQFGALAGLAENASLQLYMTELTRVGDRGARITGGLAESGYLRNLLTIVADRAGFTAPPSGPDVAANVRRIGVAGIALVDAGAKVVAATDAMPPLDGRLGRFVRDAPKGAPALLDMFVGAGGRPSMAFSVPVFAIQDRRARQIGRIIAVKEVARELAPLLAQPGVAWETARAVLVRRSGAAIEYLSATGASAAAAGPLERSIAFDTPGLAARFAIDKPGGFAIRRDWGDTEVLVTARRISRAPWTLMYKIARAEALGASEKRLSRLIAISLLVIALLALAIVAAWRHGTSQRARRAADRYADMARRLEAQSRLLRLVTDSQPSPMFIVDQGGTYRFANRAAALGAGMANGDMIGKTMTSVIGAAAARRYDRLNHEAMASGRAQSEVRRAGANGASRVVQAEHIPIVGSADLPGSVMVVEEDITAAVTERERRARVLEQLIETLLAIVDRRDPYAADHSVRVAAAAGAIAEEMGLDETAVATAETAGRLMNLGKILVPSDLLTRSATLDESEIRQVRESIRMSAELLDGVEFDGPVVETLRQLQERWDGSGTPAGLEGEEILITARIVAVANAFVAMVSPRAFRSAVSFDEAAARLLADIGTAFERRVVAAFVNVLENRSTPRALAAVAGRAP